jgi:hypothetical protein
MNTSAKRAFSALATVSILTFIMFGIVALTVVPVSAEEEQITLSGPANGNAGETLTYSVYVSKKAVFGEKSVNGRSHAQNYQVQIRFADLDRQTVTTDETGHASASYAFTQPGTYQVSAVSTGIVAIYATPVQVTIAAAATPNPSGATPNPSAIDNGGTGGDGQSSAAPLLSEEGIADIATQAETATGLGSNWLLIVLAVVIIVILAIIATALLMRRRD